MQNNYYAGKTVKLNATMLLNRVSQVQDLHGLLASKERPSREFLEESGCQNIGATDTRILYIFGKISTC
jgi:hypothetical protein